MFFPQEVQEARSSGPEAKDRLVSPVGRERKISIITTAFNGVEYTLRFIKSSLLHEQKRSSHTKNRGYWIGNHPISIYSERRSEA